MAAKRNKSARKAPQRATYGGGETKKLALVLLSQGMTLSAVGREVGVGRKAIREWRDSREGEEFLAKALAERANVLNGAVTSGLLRLQDAVGKATNVLIDKMDSTMPFEAIAAAKDVLDRAGLIRGERIEVAPGAKVVALPNLEDDLPPASVPIGPGEPADPSELCDPNE